MLLKYNLIIAVIIFSFEISSSQNCQCIYLTGTQGQLWGKFIISSSDKRFKSYECAIIYITGSNQEIIELRFEEIILQKKCVEQLHLFPHLKEPLVQNEEPEETIFTKKNFRIRRYREAIFSSDRILGIRLIYGHVPAFTVIGKFQFIDKVLFKNDGILMPTTYCDYQFLPLPISYRGKEVKSAENNNIWRYFHSPRYPAKYPSHIKCMYKFIGRPRNRVEILFEEIFLLTGHSSCLRHSDKITVYDNKISNKSSIIDVICNEKPSRRIISSGSNLLIEFEAGSNRTSNGFSAKYRFIDIFLSSSSSSLSSSINESFDETSSSNSIDAFVIGGIKESNITKQYSNQQIITTGNKVDVSAGNTLNNTRICPPGVNCDKIINSSISKNGTIQSPLFPGPYPARTFCRYEFHGREKERIQITFFEFSLPANEDHNCEEADSLQILVPTRQRYELIETLCGEAIPKPIMSEGSRMLIEFRGRESGKGSRGFKAEYKFLENFGITSGTQLNDTECSFAFNSTDSRSGWFHSPNFPGSYPRNLKCNYYFYGQINDRIFIRFTYFDVEGIFPCEESTASDYVEFSNFLSPDRKFLKFCGKREGFTIRSDGPFFRITFITNDRFDKTGFRASYTFELEPSTTENIYLSKSSNVNQIDYLVVSLSFIILHFCRGIFRVLQF